MASAQKCGICQQKTTPKNTSGGQSSEPVTAAQPISTGAAPGTPPKHGAAAGVPLEHHRVEDGVVEDRARRERRGQQRGGQPRAGRDRRDRQHDAEDQRAARRMTAPVASGRRWVRCISRSMSRSK